MIAGVDDDGIVVETLGLEVVEEALQIVVHTLHAAEVLAEVSLIGEASGLALGKLGDIVVSGQLLGKALLEVHGIGTAQIAFADGGADMRRQFILITARGDGAEAGRHIVERRRLGDLHIGEVFLIARGVFKIIVRCLELVADEERLVRVTLGLEPLEGGISDGVRGMFAGVRDGILGPRLGPLNTELRVEVLPLPREYLVIVEIRLRLKVPLADHGGLVTGLAEENGQGLVLGLDATTEVEYAVYVRVLTGDDAGSAGCANGVHAKGIVEGDTFSRQFVERGSRVERL